MELETLNCYIMDIILPICLLCRVILSWLDINSFYTQKKKKIKICVLKS